LKAGLRLDLQPDPFLGGCPVGTKDNAEKASGKEKAGAKSGNHAVTGPIWSGVPASTGPGKVIGRSP